MSEVGEAICESDIIGSLNKLPPEKKKAICELLEEVMRKIEEEPFSYRRMSEWDRIRRVKEGVCK